MILISFYISWRPTPNFPQFCWPGVCDTPQSKAGSCSGSVDCCIDYTIRPIVSFPRLALFFLLPSPSVGSVRPVIFSFLPSPGRLVRRFGLGSCLFLLPGLLHEVEIGWNRWLGALKSVRRRKGGHATLPPTTSTTVTTTTTTTSTTITTTRHSHGLLRIKTWGHWRNDDDDFFLPPLLSFHFYWKM